MDSAVPARLGMEFNWSVKLGVLVWLFLALKFALTAYFGADVDAHRAAYLTGGAGGVRVRGAGGGRGRVAEAPRRLGWRKPFRVPPLFLLAVLVFAASLVWVVCERPVGAAIAAAFIGLVLVVSIVSRAWRIDRVPLRRRSSSPTRRPSTSGRGSRRPTTRSWCHGGRVRSDLRSRRSRSATRHRIPGTVPIMFVLAELADPSDFHHRPLVRIARENGRVVIHMTRCSSIPHALAAAALEIASEGGGAGGSLRLVGGEPGDREPALRAVRHGQRAVDGAQRSSAAPMFHPIANRASSWRERKRTGEPGAFSSSRPEETVWLAASRSPRRRARRLPSRPPNHHDQRLRHAWSSARSPGAYRRLGVGMWAPGPDPMSRFRRGEHADPGRSAWHPALPTTRTATTTSWGGRHPATDAAAPAPCRPASAVP